MVQIEGTYEIVSQENYKEYLLSLGLNDEQATKLKQLQDKVVISAVNSDQITVGYGSTSVTFPLDQQHEHTLSINHKVWTTVTLNDDSVVFKTKLTEDGSLTEEKVFKITDGGLTSTSTNSKGVKAVRKYKRV